ncbi:MAG: prepilin peptidase [Flavobacteriaceae bacterium]|nr:prepilin peptidase [Flavobacteriaceae bacterium]
MKILILTSLAIVLLLIAYQDIKQRAIHVVLPVLLFAISLVYWSQSFIPLEQLLYSFGFVLLCLAAIVIQFSIKNRRLANPFNVSFGMGDVVFLIAVIPLFTFFQYLIFFVCGMLFSILAFGVSQLIKKNQLIPLAGYLSVFLILLGVYSFINPNYFFIF